jgi:hypothetical protein
MNVNKLFPSKYLKAGDIDDDRKVTIERLRVEKMENDGTEKPVLYFAGSDKGLVMNKTNALVLASAFGDDIDGWAGKKCVLYTVQVDFQGKLVDGIRVRVPNAMRGADAKPKSAPSDADFNSAEVNEDDLPF